MIHLPKYFGLELAWSCVPLMLLVFPANGVTAHRAQMSRDHVANYSGFLSMHGKALQPNQTYDVVEVLRNCECRHLCMLNRTCVAFSVLSVPYDRLLCSLANGNVYTNTPASVPHSTYYVRPDPQDYIGVDNLVYRRLVTAVLGVDASRKECEQIPGFRLVSVRFRVQMPILLELCLGRKPTTTTESCVDSSLWFFVDMKKIDNVPMFQGKISMNYTNLVVSYSENTTNSYDVLINDDAAADLFIYARSRKLHDNRNLSQRSKPVCQANLFNVPW